MVSSTGVSPSAVSSVTGVSSAAAAIPPATLSLLLRVLLLDPATLSEEIEEIDLCRDIINWKTDPLINTTSRNLDFEEGMRRSNN